ncbi:MAG TPA: STAS domain-containing protein [Anaerolineales bacterium]
MKTDIRQEGAVTMVAVTESVDALTAPDLTRTLSEQIEAGHSNLVVDLTGVEFMSSSGLRTLLGAVKESRTKGGDLRIASTNPGIDKVLKMSGFHNVAKVFTSSREALASFAS